MDKRYATWIRENVPDPKLACREVTEAMVGAFPELRRVCGTYVCQLAGPRPHWWCLAPDGAVVDPTAAQFVSLGEGDYEEFSQGPPLGKCLCCGSFVFEGSHSFYFCTRECRDEAVRSMGL